MSIPTGLPFTATNQEQSCSQVDVAVEFVVALDALDRRELLEPALLLSAGYLALPFLVKQGLLFLAPMGALLGFHWQGETHDLSA